MASGIRVKIKRCIGFTLLVLMVYLGNLGIVMGQNQRDFNYEYAIVDAVRQKNLGNIQEAVVLYQKALDSYDKLDGVWFELGNIFFEFDEKAKSVTYFRNAWLLDPENYYYVKAYASSLIEINSFKDAAKVCRLYLKNNESIEIELVLSQALLGKRRYRKALTILERIEEQKGFSPLISLKKIDIFKSAGKHNEAQNVFEVLFQKFPENPDYMILAAEYYKDAGLENRAHTYYEKAYTIDSSNIYALSNLVEFYHEKGLVDTSLYYLDIALQLEELSIESKINSLKIFLQREGQITEYETIDSILQKLEANYPESLDIKILSYEFYMENNKIEKAWNLIIQLVDKLDDNYSVWSQAFYVAGMLEKYDEILDLGKRAYKIYPNKPEIKLFSGMAYFQLEKYEDSYNELLHAYGKNLAEEQHKQLLILMAESAYKSSRKTKSFELFEELLVVDSLNYMAMNNYAYYLALDCSYLDRAAELSRITIEKHPDNETYIDTYAWIMFRSGRFDIALKWINKIDLEDASDPEVLFHFACIFQKTDQTERAKELFNYLREISYAAVIDNGKIICDCEK